MPDDISSAVNWDQPPTGLDTIASDLSALRSAAGDPSFAEIALRISAARAARGVPPYERRVSRSTVFYNFKSGRTRIDTAILLEIAAALGLPDEWRPLWIARIRSARAVSDGSGVAGARDRIPAPVTSFTGRTRELSDLESLFTRPSTGETSQTAWVTAMPGSGKTQLALRTAQRLDRCGIRTIFLDLRGHTADSVPVAPSAAQRTILRLLGVHDSANDEASRARNLARELFRAPTLLILDDASGPEQVRAILGPAPRGRVLVTSRARAESGWREFVLGGLCPDETVELLDRLAERLEPRGAARADVERLVTLTGGLPLATALVGGRIATSHDWTLTEHIDLLEARVLSGRLDDPVREELDLSYAGLPRESARLLRSLADLPISKCDADDVALILDGDHDAGMAALDVLRRRNLVIDQGASQITLHALVRAYGLDRATETDSPRTRRELFARVAHSYAQRVWSAYETICREVGDSPRSSTFSYAPLPWSVDEASAWLEDRYSDVLLLAHQAPGRGRPDLLCRMSEGMSWWLGLSGRVHEALQLHEAAADVATELNDADALAMASLDAGQLYIHQDKPDRALEHFDRASRVVSDTRSLNDPGLIGVVWNMEALLHIRRGQLDRAIERLERAVELHSTHDETTRLLSALNNLCVALHNAGRFDDEARVLEQGLEWAERANHEMFRAYLLLNRADLRAKTGDSASALADAIRGRAIAASIDIPYLVIKADTVRAEALRIQGDTSSAQVITANSLEYAQEVGAALPLLELMIVAAHIATDSGERTHALSILDQVSSQLADGNDHMLRGRTMALRAQLAANVTDAESLTRQARSAYAAAGAHHKVAELTAQ